MVLEPFEDFSYSLRFRGLRSTRRNTVKSRSVIGRPGLIQLRKGFLARKQDYFDEETLFKPIQCAFI